MITLPNRGPLLKPAAYAGLNRLHPFAANVVCAYFMYTHPPTKTTPNSLGVLDSGPNRMPADLTNAGAIAVGAYGNELVITTSLGGLEVATDTRHAPSGQVTILARIKSTGGATQRNWIVIRGTNPISYWLCIHDSSVSGDGAGFYNSGYFVSGKNTNIAADGLWHVVAGTIKTITSTTSDAAYYIDGRLDKRTTGLASVMPAASVPLDIGFYQGDASHFVGSIESLVVLNIALQPAQVAAVSRNLYAFIAQPRAIIANLAAAGASARRLTQPIVAT